MRSSSPWSDERALQRRDEPSLILAMVALGSAILLWLKVTSKQLLRNAIAPTYMCFLQAGQFHYG